MQGHFAYKTRELSCASAGQEIYGLAYLPEREGKLPLVIFSHELCSTHRSGAPYAQALASQGIAVYTFDFRGGSRHSRSQGSTEGMSVMTEAEDLSAVLDAAKGWDFVDAGRILLMGASQGGMASAIVAARRPEEIRGLILLYPALLIRDAVRAQFGSLDQVPERFKFKGWIMVAKNYVADVWNYDVYADMPKFKNPVLLLHGSQDSLVDPAYSQRAADSYPNARLRILEGADHIFRDSYLLQAVDEILPFLRQLGFLS